MDESGAPCVQDVDVEGFRRNLESSGARDDFYEPITHPFPPDPADLKGTSQLSPSNVSTLAAPLQGGETDMLEATIRTVTEPKRSISQEIIDVVAYSATQEVSSASFTGRIPSDEANTVEMDASTKSIFNNLIISPSRGSSRVSRRESEVLPEGDVDLTEVDEVSVEDRTLKGGVNVEDEPPQRDERPRYYSNSRATTLPAKLESKTFDPNNKHAKLTRWEVFKRKFYLGVAYNMNTTSTRPPIEDADVPTPRASTAGPIDLDSFCEVTNIEGLDLEGIPPMTQRSRKLFSWTRLKTGFPFKRNKATTGKGKGNDDVPKGGDPDDMVAPTVDEEEGSCSQPEDEEDGATTSKAATTTATTKDKSHSWFEVLSHRLFTATRRQRTVENAPTRRPATAHTQQYYEIESNW